ncbi:multimerin-2 [Arapaima gigas]
MASRGCSQHNKVSPIYNTVCRKPQTLFQQLRIQCGEQSNMTAMTLVVLLMVLVVVACGDIRARDPEVEEEPTQSVGRSGWEQLLNVVHRGHSHPHPHQRPVHSPSEHGYPSEDSKCTSHSLQDEPAPLSGETETPHYLAHKGNWCPYVQHRMVTTVVLCGMEKYTIKSQSPCPIGTPDCQLVMYKLSTRPVYRERQKMVTVLLWRCCPGYAGHSCEDTVEQGHVLDPSNHTAGSPHPEGPESHHSSEEKMTYLVQEQNDFQASGQSEGENITTTAIFRPGHHHDHNHTKIHGFKDLKTDPITLPVDLTKVLMAQILPLLDGFNQSLQRLSQEVGDLSRDLAELKQSQGLHSPQEEPARVHEGFKAKLDDTFHEFDQMKEMLTLHHEKLEDRLHSQQVMLHNNMTNLKTDMDSKIKHNQKLLQGSLQSLSESLAEVKSDQKRLEEEVQNECNNRGSVSPSQLLEGPAVWEAIKRLDNKVVNNTIVLNAMLEDLVLVKDNTFSLQREYHDLNKNITETGRHSRIFFMETGLEVEAAKVEVLNQVNKLAKNITDQGDQLKEMESDVDYLFLEIHKNVNSSPCDCKAITTALSKLEQDVANVTEVARENKLSLEESIAVREHWEMDCCNSVVNVRTDLLQVQETLSIMETRSLSMENSLSDLKHGFLENQQDLRKLKEMEKLNKDQMDEIDNNFKILLKDAIRHSEVLELLLGEEVLEFKERPRHEQEMFSIPVLQGKIKHMHEQIRNQNLSMLYLKNSIRSEGPGRYESSVLTDGSTRGLKKRSRDERMEGPPDSQNHHGPSFMDLQIIEREVVELEAELSSLKDQNCLSCCNCSDKSVPLGRMASLQSEVAVMRKALEDHLRLFKDVFSNAEFLADSSNALDLSQLWNMVKRKGEKKQRRHHKEKKDQTRSQSREKAAALHSKREASLGRASKD